MSSAEALPVSTGKQGRLMSLIVRHPILPTLAFFIVMVVTFIIISPVSRRGEIIFLSPVNLANIFEATAGFSIGAFAMTLVLLVGCTDLSSESIIALTCVIFAVCLESFGMNFATALFVAFAAGAACGAVSSCWFCRDLISS